MAQEELAITIRGRDMASGALKSIAGRFLSITAAVYALQRAFRAAMTAAIEFNKQLHNVWTLVDKAWAQMQRLGEEVRGLAYKFNVMAAQATKALYQIYSAVFYGSSAFEILEVSIKGAAAGLSDVFTVADMLTTVLNAWGLAASESNRIMDLLFTTIKYGKTTMPELAAQFGRLAGVAAPIGAKIAEMTAAIATLTRQGIATDWAITSLRQTLMQFLRPPAELAKIFTALGYASGSALIHTQGFAKALGLVTEYAAANNIRMEQLFTNVRAVTAVLPLATTAAEGFAADLERMASSAGMAQIAFEKQAKAWSYQLETLKSRINDFAITLGELFVPALVGALKAITLILAPLKELLKLFNKLGGAYFVAIAAGVGTLTLAVWGLTKAYAALSAVFATTLTMGALSTANIGAQIGALLYRLGRGGMLLGAGKLFGAGLAGAFAVKQLVNFDLGLGEVTGIESVKRGLYASIKAILGGVVAGAIVGGVTGAVIGAIVTGAVIVIRVIHEVVEAGRAGYITPGEAAALVPEYIGFPKVTLTLEELAGEILRAAEIADYGTDAVAAMAEALREFYSPRGFPQLGFALKAVYQEALTLSEGLTGAFQPTLADMEQLVDDLIESYKQAIDIGDEFMVKGFLSETQLSKLRAFLLGHIEDYHNALRQSAVEFGITSKKIWGYVDSFGIAAAALSRALETGQPLELLVPTIEGVVKSFQNMIAAFPREIQLQAIVDFLETISTYDPTTMERIPSEWEAMILEILGITETELAKFLLRYQGIIPSFEAVTENILTEFALAQEAWAAFVATLSDQNITTEEAITTWDAMGEMLDKWSTIADIAEIKEWDLAEALRAFADMMDLLINGAEAGAETLYAQFQKLSAAYKEAGEGSLEQALALEGLISVYIEAQGHIELLKEQEIAADEKLLKLIADLEELGITIKAIHIDTLLDQYRDLKVIFDASIPGSIEYATALAGLQSIFERSTILQELLAESGIVVNQEWQEMIDVLAALFPMIKKTGKELQNFFDALAESVSQLAGLLRTGGKSVMAEVVGAGATAAKLGGWIAGLGGTVKIIEGLTGFAKTLAIVGEALTGVGLALAVAAGIVLVFNTATEEAARVAEEAAEAAKEVTEEVMNTLLGLADVAQTLARSFMDLIVQTEAYTTLQDTLNKIEQLFVNTLFAFLWPLVAIAEHFGLLLGITDLLTIAKEKEKEEITALLRSFNIPFGFKLERAAWGVATPGQPWLPEEKPEKPILPEVEIPEWARNLIAPFVAIIGRIGGALKGFFDVLVFLAATIAEPFTGVALTVLESFAKPLEGLGNWIRDTLAPDLAAFFTAFGEWWRTDVDPFLQEKVFPQLGKWGKAIYEWIKTDLLPFLKNTVWPFFKNELWPVIVKGLNALGAALKELWEYIVAHWPEIKELIIDGIIAWFTNLVDKIKGVTSWLDLLINPIATVAGFLGQFVSALWNAVTAIPRFIVEMGINIVKLGANLGIFAMNALIGLINLIPFIRIPLIPYLQTRPGESWDVARTGAAIVHRGETVGRGGGDTYVYNVTLPGVTNAQQFDEELQKIIWRKNLRKTGNRIGPYATQGQGI